MIKKYYGKNNYLLKKNIFIILKITMMSFKDIAMILAGVAILVLVGLWAMGDLKVEPPFGTVPDGMLQNRGQTGNPNDWPNNLSSLPVAVMAGDIDHVAGEGIPWYGYNLTPGAADVGGVEFKEHDKETSDHHAHHHTRKKLALQGAYSNMGVPAIGNFNLNRGAFKTKRLIRGYDFENISLGIPGATPEEREEQLDHLFFPLMNPDKITAEDRSKMYAHTPLNNPIGNASNSEFVGDSSIIYNVKRLQDQAV